MARILLLVFISFYGCVTVDEQPRFAVANQKEFSFHVCFWNVKNLSKDGLSRANKGHYIIQFAKECDVIAFMEIRSAKVDMAEEFETALNKTGNSYQCMEGIPKGDEDGTRREKYLTCVNKEKVTDMQKAEFDDKDNDFSRPPTFFLLDTSYKKFLIIPFHSVPGDKNELISFEKVVNATYQNYSERRSFFGGDFNTGKSYQKPEFVKSLSYFKILENLINEPTTFANQEHDLLFTDPVTASNCKGIVWRLDELYPEVEGRKELEKISDHFPVSAKCVFKY